MAPKPTFDAQQYLDEDHQRLAEFAAWAYEDDPDEGEMFLDYHMEKRGYTRQQGWGPRAEPDPRQQSRAAGAGAPAAGPRRPAYFKR